MFKHVIGLGIILLCFGCGQDAVQSLQQEQDQTPRASKLALGDIREVSVSLRRIDAPDSVDVRPATIQVTLSDTLPRPEIVSLTIRNRAGGVHKRLRFSPGDTIQQFMFHDFDSTSVQWRYPYQHLHANPPYSVKVFRAANYSKVKYTFKDTLCIYGTNCYWETDFVPPPQQGHDDNSDDSSNEEEEEAIVSAPPTPPVRQPQPPVAPPQPQPEPVDTRPTVSISPSGFKETESTAIVTVTVHAYWPQSQRNKSDITVTLDTHTNTRSAIQNRCGEYVTTEPIIWKSPTDVSVTISAKGGDIYSGSGTTTFAGYAKIGGTGKAKGDNPNIIQRRVRIKDTGSYIVGGASSLLITPKIENGDGGSNKDGCDQSN